MTDWITSRLWSGLISSVGAAAVSVGASGQCVGPITVPAESDVCAPCQGFLTISCFGSVRVTRSHQVCGFVFIGATECLSTKEPVEIGFEAICAYEHDWSKIVACWGNDLALAASCLECIVFREPLACAACLGSGAGKCWDCGDFGTCEPSPTLRWKIRVSVFNRSDGAHCVFRFPGVGPRVMPIPDPGDGGKPLHLDPKGLPMIDPV